MQTTVESSPDSSGAQSGVSIENLTIRVGKRLLLSGASAEFPPGKVSLVIGASGAGKTVLMKVLAGLLRSGDGSFEVEGSIRVCGEEILGRGSSGRRTPVGIVFQNAALFDELSALENVAFARDHRPRATRDRGPSGSMATPEQLLDELGVPRRVPVGSLSGGQKQRLAIARTLAYDPPIIIYDEPTAGLDAANALRVAERIRSTGQMHGKTSIVVTHDYEHLAGIASEIYLLDPERRLLRRLTREEMDGLSSSLPGATTYQDAEPPPDRTWALRFAFTLRDFLETTCLTFERGLASLASLVPLWRSLRWGLRYLRHYLGLVASPSAWLYFGSAGVIAGFVSTHFVFKFLPHKKYTEPLISDELLNGLGFALYRILVPVLLSILVAARCGAAVASDVGNRVYSHQVDAMRSMGARPSRYLLTAILYAFLVGAPCLVGIGFLAARYTSLAVYVYNYPDKGADYWDGNFHRDLRIPGEPLYRGSLWLLAKVLVCGLGVGVLAYQIGMREKPSGVEVSRGITTTIITATLFVLITHFVFAFLEF